MSLADLEPFGYEWAREQDARHYGEAVHTLADHHSFWHALNGALAVCPWDCGAGEYADEPDAYSEEPDEAPVEWWTSEDAPF